ncbi:LysR family transcriptional regulator [Saccharopolyspora shandongensis]|uniref:LysR family transcriptional regulator n=1 Tax=Saccharopolyspora shandongensis TaxID=418495 RepID=UPI00115FC079|nr:LysR family transcriptional regulator [Saccharopolyspora shandongensis]
MSGTSIDILDLRVFLAVARAGSFGRAAVELQLAQPSVSARMAALERKLGTRLFDRGPRGTVPTRAGERLGDYARRCLALLAETEAAVRAEGVERLVVAAPASIGMAVFPTVLAAMPGHVVDVVCQIEHSDEAVAALLDGSTHAAYVLRRVLPAGLDSVAVADSPVIAVAAPDNPVVDLAAPQPDDFATTPVIVHNWSEQAKEIVAMFAGPQRGPDHPIRLVGTPDIAVDLAASAGYVAVVPWYAAARALAEGRVRRLPLPDLGVVMPIRLVYRTEMAQRPAIQLLLEVNPELHDRLASATEPPDVSASATNLD